MTANSLTLDMDLPSTPVREGYALFASAIAELRNPTLRIDGDFALRARLTLPTGELTLAPQLQGLAVQGLGTEQWAQARSLCDQGLPKWARLAKPSAQSLLARAVIAAEDQRYFEHAGYDLTEITLALRGNQRGLECLGPVTPDARATRGQHAVAAACQAVGHRRERSPVRKLRELLYAVEMEQTLGKARILGLYLDVAPWGGQLCGARAAAYRYFGKRADRLSASEAAWLAAMLHNPSMEARRWAATGQINHERAQWVARGMRLGGASAPRRPTAKMVAAHG
ncbi:MAG: transglycosylase domain-containing protein [Rhodoferax sp.]|nr:transglycosylase domain-containing protein [Rhodoferax sp.]